MEIKDQINMALQFHQAGQFAEAEKKYSEILKLAPNNANVLNLFGLLKYQNKQFEEAISYIKKAVEINPSAYFYDNLGSVYRDSEKLKDAIEAYKKALELTPNDFEILFNLAFTYKKDNQTDKAIETYQKALSINPDSADIYFNLGNLYEEKNESQTALSYYEKAIKYKPDDKEINYFLAILYLKTKNFKEGWKYFEKRPSKDAAILTQSLVYKTAVESAQLWSGEPIKDKTLYVYYEAGLGDTIMFTRFVPLLKDKCARVLFKPQIDLVSFYKENDLNAEVLSNKTIGEDIKFDVHIPIMGLVHALGLNAEEQLLRDNYLKANPEKVKAYKEKYFNNDKFKVGIKWQGNKNCGVERGVPLEAFYKILDLPNTKFYSVQKGEGIEQLATLPEKYDVDDLGTTFDDFSDTAAAIENLDLIITNDTSIAHLAGALGKQCWIVLPFVQNWRWHTDLSYSPWYKSVKLFKQSEEGNWDGVFEKVYGELKRLLG